MSWGTTPPGLFNQKSKGIKFIFVAVLYIYVHYEGDNQYLHNDNCKSIICDWEKINNNRYEVNIAKKDINYKYVQYNIATL